MSALVFIARGIAKGVAKGGAKGGDCIIVPWP